MGKNGAVPSLEPRHWPIFVVSLADADERRRTLLAQLQAFDVEAEFIDAVDGRRSLSPELQHLIDRERAEGRLGRKISDGEFACALSHQGLYQRILDESLPGAIILEDDALLTPGFGAFIAHKGYLAAELVQMDHLDARVWRQGHLAFLPEITFLPLASNASLSTGYSLSAKAACYILEHSRPLAGLADWPCDLMPLAPVVTLPRLVDHPNIGVSGSTLERARKDAKKSATPAGSRSLRFFKAGYWRRWWFKRRTKKIS